MPAGGAAAGALEDAAGAWTGLAGHRRVAVTAATRVKPPLRGAATASLIMAALDGKKNVVVQLLSDGGGSSSGSTGGAAMPVARFGLTASATALYELADSMGLEGVDDIDRFGPKMARFLAAGNSVDTRLPSTRSAKAGGKIYNHKTLAGVAASWQVNAPMCLRKLLQAGADPSAGDASGRLSALYSAAITATVSGTDCDGRCLEEIAKLPGSELMIAQARAKRLMYDALRAMEGDESHVLTRHQRRQLYSSMLRNGFTSFWGCVYTASQVGEYLCPMLVVPLETFHRHGSIPRHSQKLGVSVDAIEADATVVFFSHRWLRASADISTAHPDDERGTKFQQMLAVMSAVKAKRQQQASRRQQPSTTAASAFAGGSAAAAAVVADDGSTCPSSSVWRSKAKQEEDTAADSRSGCYIWVDYACIDQDDHATKLRGINSLPIFIDLCDSFCSVHHAEYRPHLTFLHEMSLA